MDRKYSTYRHCVACQKEFLCRGGKHKFCENCPTCPICGKISRYQQRCCSRRCAEIDAAWKTKPCVVCGKNFSPYSKTAKRFMWKTKACSPECKHKLQSDFATQRPDRLSVRNFALRSIGKMFKPRYCAYCSAQYTPTTSKQRWCGKCTTCVMCARHFDKRTAVRVGRAAYVYCSTECQYEFMQLHVRERIAKRKERKARPAIKEHQRRSRPQRSAWRRAVMERDNYTCQRCGYQPANKKTLHAHHIKTFKAFPELKYDVSNTVTLCQPCHWVTHTGPTRDIYPVPQM